MGNIDRIYTKDFEKLNKGGKIGLIIGLISLLLGVGLFYWYELRPSKIRKDCFETTTPKDGHSFPAFYNETLENDYENCLRSKGLEK